MRFEIQELRLVKAKSEGYKVLFKCLDVSSLGIGTYHL
jgi:hypothetical protein